MEHLDDSNDCCYIYVDWIATQDTNNESWKTIIHCTFVNTIAGPPIGE